MRFEDLKPGVRLRMLIAFYNVPTGTIVELIDFTMDANGEQWANFRNINGNADSEIAAEVYFWGLYCGTAWEVVTGWDEAVEAAQPKAPEPRNNDGRSACYWCGGATVSKPGLMFDRYDYCERCKK